MKPLTSAFLAVALAAVGCVGLITIFGDNLKALHGMSADALAGDTVVERRATRSTGKLEKKKLTDFARENADYGGYAGPVATPSFTPVAPNLATDTRRDALSTFAIDVDTASYTYARRALLQSSQRPEPASVRVEEWVNAFDYALAAPERAPFAVTADGATSPFDETKTLVRVALKGRVVTEAQRKPAHLVFLMDTSGSMSGPDRIDLAKRALTVLTTNLKPTDTVALVTYAGSTEVVLPPTPASETKRILSAIDGLQTGGGTNMGSGMELAYQLAVRQVRPGTTTRVVVLTDGDANIGANLSAAQMLDAVHSHVEEGVTLTTVGFGMGNYRAAALEELADKGNGQALYVDGEGEIQKVFRKGLTGTLEVIGKDVKVQVAFDPAVVSTYRLVGYENRAVADEDFRNDRVDAGELGAGHAVTALYEVSLTSTRAPLGTVTVRGQLPDSKEAFEVTRVISREDVSGQLTERGADLRFATAVALAADNLRGNARDAWSLSAIKALAAGAAQEREERLEFVKMLERADVLSPRTASAAYRYDNGY